MSNPITSNTMNIVVKLGPDRGYLSVAPMPLETKTDGGKRRYKVLFARKPFSFGDTIRGTLAKQVMMEDSEGMGTLVTKSIAAYFQEHPFDFQPWYDSFRKGKK